MSQFDQYKNTPKCSKYENKLTNQFIGSITVHKYILLIDIILTDQTFHTLSYIYKSIFNSPSFSIKIFLL